MPPEEKIRILLPTMNLQCYETLNKVVTSLMRGRGPEAMKIWKSK